LDERVANEKALSKLRSAGSSDFSSKSGRASILDSITGYVIIDEVRRGGQGVVYRAKQKSTDRSVAIKVMKDGPFSSPTDRLRFDREIHLLGQLRHPNIVTIHDSGQAGGNDYFVMDFIDGDSLSSRINSWPEVDQYENLRLFAKICDAVNAAHLRGIIHRDLKPSNILVDQEGLPHVLDFGLAKMSGDSEASTRTITGQFVGSLPWASPEQVEGIPSQIDVRTDVYALGVIFYQLLAGEFPYDVMGGPREVFDNILSVEPARPSGVCRKKNASIRLDDDLDTIVLKCLAKDREDRYQTAGEVARDIERFLTGEPISAKRDAFGYVLQKQLRKHKLPVATAVGFLVVIVVGLVTSVGLWRQAEGARAEAVVAGLAESKQRQVAEQNAAVARDAADKSSAISDFLRTMLGSVQPSEATGNRDITVREALDSAARSLDEGTLADQPSVEAALRATLGDTYTALGLYDNALGHLKRAVEISKDVHDGPDSSIAEYTNDLATLLQHMGEYQRATALFREVRVMLQELPDASFEQKASGANNLAAALLEIGGFQEARTLFEEAIGFLRETRSDDDRDVATALGNLAQLELYLGNIEESKDLIVECLEIRRKLFDGDHPDLEQALNNVAFVLHRSGDLVESEAKYREALAMAKRLYGEEHPGVATCLNNLGMLLSDKGDIAAANKAHRKSLTMRRELLPAGSRELLSSLVHVADMARLTDAFAESEALYREALAYPVEAFPQGEFDRALLKGTFASFLIELARLDEAETLLTEYANFVTHDDSPATEEDRMRVKSRLAALAEERVSSTKSSDK
jgi:eukaryotic-like serine/threonine-protein kinase